MDELLILLIVFCALGSGAIGGVFFAFSNFVMPALARLAPAEGIHAMQAINVTVVNRLFLGTFMGTGLLSMAAIVGALLTWSGIASLCVVLAGATYVLGSILVTLRGNVPLRYREWEKATQASGGGTTSSTWAGTPNVRSAAARLYLAGERQGLRGLKPITGVLWEDPQALPYARLHTNVQALGSDGEVLRAMTHPRRVNRIALTGPAGPTYNGPARVQPFTTRRVNGNRLLMEGIAPVEGLLVVAEAYDPGWKASVDGRPVKPVPVEHLLTGVTMPAGARKVELVYAPASFRSGLFGSLLALAVLCGALVPRRRHGQGSASNRSSSATTAA